MNYVGNADMERFVEKLLLTTGVTQRKYTNLSPHDIKNRSSVLDNCDMSNTITEVLPIEKLRDIYGLNDTELFGFDIIPMDSTKFSWIHSLLYLLKLDFSITTWEQKNNTVDQFRHELIKKLHYSKKLLKSLSIKYSDVLNGLSDPYSINKDTWFFISWLFGVTIFIIDEVQVLVQNSAFGSGFDIIYTPPIPDPRNPIIFIHENSRGVFSPVAYNMYVGDKHERHNYLLMRTSSVARKIYEKHHEDLSSEK